MTKRGSVAILKLRSPVRCITRLSHPCVIFLLLSPPLSLYLSLSLCGRHNFLCRAVDVKQLEARRAEGNDYSDSARPMRDHPAGQQLFVVASFVVTQAGRHV